MNPRSRPTTRTAAFALPAALALLLSTPSGCGPRDSATPGSSRDSVPPGESFAVSVSIPPQADFVQRIAGNHATVHTFVAAGQDPHHFTATPKQVLQLADSRIYFSAGMPFEEILAAKVLDNAPGLEFVDTNRGIDSAEETPEKHADEEEDTHHAGPEAHHEEGARSEAEHEDARGEHASHHDEDHDEDHDAEQGHEDHHDHGADFHYWLSPPLIKIQARNIHDALVRIDPANAADYTANLEIFLTELDELHTRLQKLLAPCKGQSIYVYHPAFSHFTDTYGLRQKSIETGGKSPTPKQLMRLIAEARDDNAKVIFVQPQFDPASAKTVADTIGGKVVSIDPLAKDVLSNLETMASTIREALADHPGSG